MAIKTKNKIGVSFNTSSMSDLVFLLLIFFMLTSTLVAPNAIKLLLPSSTNDNRANKQDVTVYINAQYQYYVGETPVTEAELASKIKEEIQGMSEANIMLRSDQSVPVQYVVNVIDIVKGINQETAQNHKVILATSPKK